jgi:hypothetical protein
MRKPSKKKVVLGLVALVLIFIAVSGIVTIVRHQAETKEYASWAEAFQPHLGEYLHSEYSPAQDAEPSQGYIRGKLVVVDSTTGELDDLNSFQDLTDLRARSPEEVGTVVLTAPLKGMVAIYENLKVGFQWTIEVTVVDFPAKMIVSRGKFTGSMPPETVRGDQAGEGERPTAEIIAFLKSLPRK